ETVDEVVERIRDAQQHIDRERLVIAPDCGLGMLTRDLAVAKLDVMCRAAALA
ncbi:MAG: 5-methyltetrahydropteroyltriglutamate--homocysteine methyltransferase, partial [Pedosphaera sp.]|nr:5-methyltetrahydropteroyltriglutamate--homocysteine methyltransferase [Pedosphaera sp.]